MDKSSKMKKVKSKPNFLEKIFMMKKFKFKISWNVASFAQIFPVCNIFINIQIGQQVVKCPNHFITSKQFQKRPNGNRASYVYIFPR